MANAASTSTEDPPASVRGPVVNETLVRAAAGMTMVLGAIAFALAFLTKQFVPIRVVTVFFFFEFTARVTLGFDKAPLGILSRLLFGHLKREWVSAAPKRFAWTLGVIMSLAMAVITNAKITGALPGTICVICLTLMWLESAVGWCAGCYVYGLLRRRGLVSQRDDYEICANGECRID